MKTAPFILLIIVSVFSLGPVLNLGKFNLNCCSVSIESSNCCSTEGSSCHLSLENPIDLHGDVQTENDKDHNCNPFSCFSCTKHFFKVWYPLLSDFTQIVIHSTFTFQPSSITEGIKDKVWHPPIV